MPAFVPLVTPIERVFPCPIDGVLLTLNAEKDLSLYRFDGELHHIWSAGRFKSLKDVQWSPDGKTQGYCKRHFTCR